MPFPIFRWSSQGGAVRRRWLEEKRKETLDTIWPEVQQRAQQTAQQTEENAKRFKNPFGTFGSRKPGHPPDKASAAVDAGLLPSEVARSSQNEGLIRLRDFLIDKKISAQEFRKAAAVLEIGAGGDVSTDTTQTLMRAGFDARRAADIAGLLQGEDTRAAGPHTSVKEGLVSLAKAPAQQLLNEGQRERIRSLPPGGRR